jgi:predicted 2-oxoglutarate/Fe(II)-dependent dioxygenase YbiX
MPSLPAFSTEIMLAAGSLLCFTVAAVGFVLCLCRAAQVADYRWEQAVEERRRTREDQQVAGDMGRSDGLGS